MGSASSTFTENWESSNRATWVFTFSMPDISITASTFTVTNGTVTAKYTGSNKGFGTCNAWYQARINGVTQQTYFGKQIIQNSTYDLTSWSSGTTKTLTNYSGYSTSVTVNTATFFNTGNKTTRSIPLTFYATYIYGSTANKQSYGDATVENGFSYETPITYTTLAYATLNVPPTIEVGTPTYATPQYAGLGAYTVPITSAEAYYGGDIQTITLTVGSDTTTKNYSSSTVTDDSISVIPTVAGTYTPTLTITDTRGQTYTQTFEQITVNPYLIPSVNFDVYRTDSAGVKNDEGHFALLQSTITYTDAIATLTEPSIQIDGIDLDDCVGASVAWYTSYNSTTGVDVSSEILDWSTLTPTNHSVTVYGLVDWSFDTTGKFAEDQSYLFTLVGNDSLGGHSLPISQTLSTAFYTIDFKAGGKEIAFGAPANDSLTEHPKGLFKCEMDAWFNGNVIGISGSLVGEIKAYAGATVPNGWLECDGSEVAIADYPLLYDAIQDLWGTPSDSDHFILPNMKGKVPVGQDTSATPDADFDTVGETGGEKTHLLTGAESGIKAHNHTFGANFYIRHGKDSGTIWVAAGTNTTITEKAYSNTWAGGGSLTSYSHKPDRVNINGGVGTRSAENATNAHNNLQPYAVVKYIICTGE